MVATAVDVVDPQQRSNRLFDLSVGVPALVLRIDRDTNPAISRRLLEIGFFSGELLQVVSKVLGGDPLAVRIGSSTFALRRHEAESVLVQTVA